MDDSDPRAAPSLRQIDLAVMAASELHDALRRLRDRVDGPWPTDLMVASAEESARLLQSTSAHLSLFARESCIELRARRDVFREAHGSPGGG